MITIARCPEVPGGYRLTCEQRLPRPLAEVFPFFADATNLERLTPPWLHFHVLTPQPIEMRLGAMIDYWLRVRGLPLRWRTRINAWQPPHRFVDEQLRGPYRQWVHEHTFHGEGSETVVRDQVDYVVPGGALVHGLLVKPDIRRIFSYRQHVLEGLFPR